MKEAIPVFREENTSFMRQEKKGFALLISKRHPEARELVINETAQEIMRLCDGKSSIAQVVGNLKRKYPTVEEEKLHKDVQRVLAKMSRLGVITWVAENPFLLRREEVVNGELCLRIGFEEDISKAREFLHRTRLLEQRSAKCHSSWVKHVSPLVSDLEYDELVLRQKLFAYSEQFFFLTKGDQIEGLISFTMPFRPIEAAALRLLACPAEHGLRLLRYAVHQMPYLATNPITKVKWYELIGADGSEVFQSISQQLGFEEEGWAHDELGFDKDIRTWAHSYAQQYIAFVQSKRRELRGER